MIQLSSNKQKKSTPQLELAPLIDIIFILLIFFAVSSTLIVHKQGIKLDLPSAATTTTEKKGLTISVDRRQNVFIDQKKMTVDLITKTIEAEMKKNPELRVILHADEATPYSRIIEILDNVRAGGCFNLVLQTKTKTKHNVQR